MVHDMFFKVKEAPVRREVLAEKIVHKFLDLIRSGNLKAGDKIPAERELLKIFGVSRQPIREALSALSILGVIETRQGGGAVITDLDAKTLLGPLEFFLSLSNDNVTEVFECRRIIECETARKAGINGTDQEKRDLASLVDAQEKVTDPISFRMMDKEFHKKISKMAGNVFQASLIDALYNLGLEAGRVATENPAIIERSIKEHRTISAAILAGDGDKAFKAMNRHLKSVEKFTLEFLPR